LCDWVVVVGSDGPVIFLLKRTYIAGNEKQTSENYE
jgi:hypothetical protein